MLEEEKENTGRGKREYQGRKNLLGNETNQEIPEFLEAYLCTNLVPAKIKASRIILKCIQIQLERNRERQITKYGKRIQNLRHKETIENAQSAKMKQEGNIICSTVE